MKASNPKVMIAAYRLLVSRLDALGWDYPLHLGVTEAGNAEDGRIKSSIGIGSLLDDGLGDTIRVSLTEEPEEEIPVAFAIARPYNDLIAAGGELSTPSLTLPDLRDPYHYVPRPTYEVAVGAVKVGGMQHAVVVATADGGESGDMFASVADLAKRKGPNAIRPDIIRVSLSGLKAIAPLAEELRRRGEEEDPSVGKSALGLVVILGAGSFRRAAEIAPQLTGIGAIEVSEWTHDPYNQQAFEELVLAALAARVPLWLRAQSNSGVGTPVESMQNGAEFEEVELVLKRAAQAHALGHRGLVLSLFAQGASPSYLVRAYRLLSSRLTEAGRKYPIHVSTFVEPTDDDKLPIDSLITGSIEVGSLLCDGIGNSVGITGDGTDDEQVELAFNILQASGSRTVKAEFVACPSCGRTLFDLQETTERIKKATGHLRGVKIAVMGCIVNGLGELADADFGYMGGAPGKVNLFVGKECVEKGVPAEDAVQRLIDIIKKYDKWTEPAVRV
jgi:(E)-4-hydroxy-3-methylbut-2-enyl-diphosphate synthase